jgi:hypothetical protein
MTREEALAMYHSIRVSVRRILRSAISVCNQSDFMRAAKVLGLWADGKIVLPDGDEAAEMLSDIALFEPNQRGRRAFDVFLSGRALQLDAADSELVQSTTRDGRTPFRHSFAVTLYGDSLRRRAPLSSEAEDAFRALLTGLAESGPSSQHFGAE